MTMQNGNWEATISNKMNGGIADSKHLVTAEEYTARRE
jgi:hypothetical protein